MRTRAAPARIQPCPRSSSATLPFTVTPGSLWTPCSGNRQNSAAARAASAATMTATLFSEVLRAGSRIALVAPGMGGVGVPAQLPISQPVASQHLDVMDPLGPLPGIELGGDDPHRTAVLDRQGFPFGGVDEQHVVLERLFQGEVGG